jgi:hypothetical protein
MPNPENVIPHQWKKGQSGNPKGRKAKTSQKQLADYMKAHGVEAISNEETMEMYKLIFNAPEWMLKSISEDQECPMVLKTTISLLRDKRFKFLAMKDYRDFCFKNTEEAPQIIYNVDVSPEKAREIRKALRKEYS